ncbi:unnamed protein product [Trifolium pratense]|uniref:Uncharacterized protein n=1 Tax=Trifolium pratense TaxID=57577 RepID=A0ACB0LBM0_TRIPR|nr:unnamed protein product [Trifolium pratense]
MENIDFTPNSHLAAIYYNQGNSNLFRINVDVTLVDLKNQLTELSCRLHGLDQRRVTEVVYRRPSVCSDGKVLLTKMKLHNDEDVISMMSIFSQFMTKGPIELDVNLVRSVEDILANMVAPGDGDVETINLADDF